MLRGTHSITAIVASVCALAGCSVAATPEDAATTVEAATLAPQCSHGGQGGALTVTLISFDAQSLELQAVTSRGALVVGRFTPATLEVAANLRTFPPDPIFPACTDDATTYDQSAGEGLTRSLLADLGALAGDGCDASVLLAADGTVTSFQPVP